MKYRPAPTLSKTRVTRVIRAAKPKDHDSKYEWIAGDRSIQPSSVIGIDPGKHESGFVWITGDSDHAWRVFMSDRLKNEDLWFRLRVLPQSVLVVCEAFRLYKWAAADLVGSDFLEVRCIGRIEEIQHQAQWTLWMVPPAAHKQTFSLEWLKHVGTWSRNSHINDAISLAWYGLTRWNGTRISRAFGKGDLR